jgi:hypothetical protein
MFPHALTFLIRSWNMRVVCFSCYSFIPESFNLKSLRRHDNFYWVPKVNWRAELAEKPETSECLQIFPKHFFINKQRKTKKKPVKVGQATIHFSLTVCLPHRTS